MIHSCSLAFLIGVICVQFVSDLVLILDCHFFSLSVESTLWISGSDRGVISVFIAGTCLIET